MSIETKPAQMKKPHSGGGSAKILCQAIFTGKSCRQNYQAANTISSEKKAILFQDIKRGCEANRDVSKMASTAGQF